jgi:hypothetical protein
MKLNGLTQEQRDFAESDLHDSRGVDDGNWPAVWSDDWLDPVRKDQDSGINILNTCVAKHQET